MGFANHRSQRWNIKDVAGAIEHEAGAIWPYRLLTGLYERLLQQYPDSLSLEANTPVQQVQFLPNQQYPYRITTPRGVLLAKKVFHCTNAHAAHLLPKLAGRIYPFRGTMTVQKPGPSFENKGASRSWSLAHKCTLDHETGLFDTGLYYLQQNARTGCVWIGNETAHMKDILTSDDTVIPERTREALSVVLPRMFLKGWDTATEGEIESIWSGIQGHTADGLPIAGRVPTSLTNTNDPADNDQWIAAGFNGYGMDKCWLTGRALVGMMLGEDVSEWFPDAFLVSEERLRGELTAEKTVQKFVDLALPGGIKESRL